MNTLQDAETQITLAPRAADALPSSAHIRTGLVLAQENPIDIDQVDAADAPSLTTVEFAALEPTVVDDYSYGQILAARYVGVAGPSRSLPPQQARASMCL